MRPLCFVLMPFGRKPDATGSIVDFDAVYAEIIDPAVAAAGFETLRADKELAGGIVHKPMFERLILCEFAVADLTTANANVFYELGVRHAMRPFSTVLVFAEGGRMPFDLALDRYLPYKLDSTGAPTDVDATGHALTERLKAAQKELTDSPVFQLVEGLERPDIARLKTDVFRDRVNYAAEMKTRLATARETGPTELEGIEKELGDPSITEAGVVIDLYLSYRSLGTERGWQLMVDLVGRMSPALAATVMVQEQLALALNRLGRRSEAERVLTELIARRGPSSETCGILGRLYKDQWKDAVARGDEFGAPGYLEKAIEAYLRGFESDWRDAYPGVNAVTLMEISQPPDPRREGLIGVIRYAVERRIAAGAADYWDHATAVELAVLAGNEEEAVISLGRALASVREGWEPATTADNLAIIRSARERRGATVAWTVMLEDALRARAG